MWRDYILKDVRIAAFITGLWPLAQGSFVYSTAVPNIKWHSRKVCWVKKDPFLVTPGHSLLIRSILDDLEGSLNYPESEDVAWLREEILDIKHNRYAGSSWQSDKVRQSHTKKKQSMNNCLDTEGRWARGRGGPWGPRAVRGQRQERAEDTGGRRSCQKKGKTLKCLK